MQGTETTVIASLPLATRDNYTLVVQTSPSFDAEPAGTSTALPARPIGTKMKHALNIRIVAESNGVWKMISLSKKSRSFLNLAQNAKFPSKRTMAAIT